MTPATSEHGNLKDGWIWPLVLLATSVATVALVAMTQPHEICALLACAAVFTFGPLVDELAIVRKLAGSMAVGATYTCWNCCLFAYTVADYVAMGRPPLLLPFLVINSWAIFASFNVVRLVDKELYVRAAAWTGYSLPIFHAFNQMFHTLPCIIATIWFMMKPVGVCELQLMSMPSVSTIMFHLAWVMRMRQGFCLDKIYFECPKWEWGLAWCTALATHILLGREIAWQCQAPPSTY